jgi:RHS repeat-associated protein
MNSSSQRPLKLKFVPIAAFLCVAGITAPQRAAAQGCCSGGRSPSAAGSPISAAFPTLNEQFGGNEQRRTVRLTHVGTQTVEATVEGQTKTLTGDQTKYVPVGGGGEKQPLPGEARQVKASLSPAQNGGVTKSEDSTKCAQPKGHCWSGTQSPIETTNATINPSPSRYHPFNTPNASTGNLPSPRSGNAPSTHSRDAREYNAAAIQGDIGQAKALVDGNNNIVGAEDTAPQILVAALLGPLKEGQESSGYLVPNSARAAGIGPEKIEYFVHRLADHDDIQFWNGVNPPSTDPNAQGLRWRSPMGTALTVLKQDTSSKVRLEVFSGYWQFSYSAPYGTYSGAVPRRTTTIERLPGTDPANPEPALYSSGYKIRNEVTGRPTRLETIWSSGAGANLYVRKEHSLEGVIGSVVYETVSKRVSNSLDRVIDLRTIEVVQQPSGDPALSAPQTIVTRSREKRHLFSWGEEVVESSVFLAPGTGDPLWATEPAATDSGWRTIYDWYDVSDGDPNFATLRLVTEPTGQWEAFFNGVPDTSVGSNGAFLEGSLKGWKDTPPPTVATAAALAVLADDAGYSGSITSKRLAQRPRWVEQYENGVLVAKSEDLTPAFQFRTTMKRYADAGTFFVTVSTRYNSGFDKDTFELKQGLTPPFTNADPLPATLIRWRHASDGLNGLAVKTVDDAAHLPCLARTVYRDMTTREILTIDTELVTEVWANGSPSISAPIGSESWLSYDDRGRPSVHSKDGVNIESWAYPTEFSTEHTDTNGVVHLYENDAQGRLLRESIAPVAPLAIANGPTLDPGNTYHVTEWFLRPPLTGSAPGCSSTLRRVSAKTDPAGPPVAVTGWRREWVEQVDGAGRTVATLDPLGTNLFTVYATTPLSGIEVTSRLGPAYPGAATSVSSSYRDGKEKSVIYPSLGGILGQAGTDQYYDYSPAPATDFRKSFLTSYTNTFTNESTSKTTMDGLGRTVSSKQATGMSGATVYIHDEITTYDAENRIQSRSLAGAPAPLFEFYEYLQAAGSSTLTVRRGLTATMPITTNPILASESATTTRYSNASGQWEQISETRIGGSLNITSSKTMPLPTSMDGNWLRTRSEKTYSGGATILTTTERQQYSAMVRDRRYVDGVLRLTVTSYNGLPMLYDTAGTTYTNKVAAFSPLREALSQASATSGYWPSHVITPNNGLPSSGKLPGGTTQKAYTWYTGNDLRAGKMKSSLHAASGSATVYYDYNARGQRIRVWGGESPSQTTYDALGRMEFLSTYRAGTGWTGNTWPATTGTADTTQWTYPPYLNLQLSKKYPDAGGQDNARRTAFYSYHPNGSLATRTWQRLPASTSTTAMGPGVVTVYLYDSFARLQTVDYPPASLTVAATPDVSYTYDTAGRVRTRTEAGQATSTYDYTAWSSPSMETVVSANTTTLPSSVVERTFDVNNNRLDLLKVRNGTTSAPSIASPDVDYNFSPTTGLLDNVVADLRAISFGYNGIGTPATSLAFAHNSIGLLNTARPLNSDGMVSGVTHNQGSILFDGASYQYDVDRLTDVVRTQEESNWRYTYDARGQIISADKSLYSDEYNTFTVVNGLQTDYTYDMAGNRTYKWQGGDTGGNQRQTGYGVANALNQYATISHPWNAGGLLDFAGQRGALTDVIKVNTQVATYQQAATVPYYLFRKELALTPSGGSRYVDVAITSTNTAVTPNVTTTLDSGKVYVPPAAETLSYDADGNLTQDARWIYKYDAENRLVSQIPAINGPAGGAGTQTSLFYTYDGLSRRVCRRTEHTYYVQTSPGVIQSGGTYTFRRSFTYDGWNMVQTLDSGYYGGDFNHSSTPSSRQTFVWGPDLGSATHGHTSWQKAGGVGGLLAVLAPAASPTGCQFPLMDRMGNVTGYRRAVSGTPVVLDAIYEYDAFGREVRSTGPASDAMPYRFSTKYTDAETGLVYYGYRFYDPDRGRWINRDPMGERGGNNLFGAVGNDLVNHSDYLGLKQGVNIDEEGFDVGDCGSFYWKVDWELNEPSPSGGLIIQKVIVTGDVLDCSTGKKSSLGPKTGPGGVYPYWEAWEIGPGGTTPKKTSVFDDDDTLAWDQLHLKGGPNTKGTLRWTTITDFYEAAGTPPSHGLNELADPSSHPAGGLPMSPTQPTGLPAGTSRVTRRSFTITWDCCNGNNSCNSSDRSSFDRNDSSPVTYSDESN